MDVGGALLEKSGTFKILSARYTKASIPLVWKMFALC
jgi:hypothetical protein